MTERKDWLLLGVVLLVAVLLLLTGCAPDRALKTWDVTVERDDG